MNKPSIQRGLRSPLFRENLQLYSLFLPLAILIFIFNYLPMWGVIIAFQDYKVGSAMFALDGSIKWVGFKHFLTFINSENFVRLVGNTLRLSVLNLLFGFTIPILFAILLNEVKQFRFKKFVQTASYLPYFISTVVVAGMALSFLEPNGIINNFLAVFGIASKEYIIFPDYYPTIYTTINVWKNFGFGSILYFSTLSSIDPALYESARIDGANRFQQAIHITLPGIQFIIAVQLVLQMGSILHTNTDLALLLYRNSTYATSDVIGTYIYRIGIEGGKYSYTTAVGLFMSVIGITLTYITNRISNKMTGYGLW
ncbi:MAG: sugar ABC transporter permease [Provencibacterium sp.]|jgi:putative aldouronate transport system permease protein|nr:sugar ABC transporter permease [Provencibacterium sp.]